MKIFLKNLNFKEFKNFRIEFICAVLGIFLLIVPGMIYSETENSDNTNESSSYKIDKDVLYTGKSYADIESEKLEILLEGINGVGRADVLIYVDSSLKTVHAGETQSKNENTEESDSNGGKRVNSNTEENFLFKVIKDENGKESLVHIYDQYPEIKGVLVSAEGADRNVIKETIIEAVSKLYGIPVHKISVVKKVSSN